MFKNVNWDITNDSLQESLLGTKKLKKRPYIEKKKCKSSLEIDLGKPRKKGGCVTKPRTAGSGSHKLMSKRFKNVLENEILSEIEEKEGNEEDVSENDETKEEIRNSGKISSSISTLARKVAKKMSGARFRWINQKLYTCTGNDAAKLFTKEPHLFTVYHEGFKEQVDKWPLNPLDNIIQYINACPPEIIVADFGCGEARLAQSVTQKVHSFDFVSLNKHIVSCDMSHVPLQDSGIDVGVFCLSLMGVNLLDYLLEARRVIKLKGILKICEIQSRIESIDKFVEQVESFGFKLCKKMCLNKMFIDFEFVLKSKKKRDSKDLSVDLKPCLYKKR